MEMETLASPRAEDVAAIHRLHQPEPEPNGAAHLEALLGRWTEDAVILPPGQPPIVGIQAISEWLQRLAEQGREPEMAEFSVPPEELKVDGDWAFGWGYLQHLSSVPLVEEPVRERGKTFRLLRRQSDGSWRIARWMWGDELPADFWPAP